MFKKVDAKTKYHEQITIQVGLSILKKGFVKSWFKSIMTSAEEEGF